ncbi:MAG: hypothetical protein CL920_34380, partial [Deltaproteobacteria bacterium]|nr:hypothetical protein [Deltaproteobacteria bacterium]
MARKKSSKVKKKPQSPEQIQEWVEKLDEELSGADVRRIGVIASNIQERVKSTPDGQQPDYTADRRECAHRLFPDKNEEDADKALRTMVSRFNRSGEDHDVSIEYTQREDGSRALHVMAPDDLQRRVEKFTEDTSSLPDEADKFEESPGVPGDTTYIDHPRENRFMCVLHAESDKRKANTLIKKLKPHLDASRHHKFELWSIKDILSGQDRVEEIQRNISYAHICVLLVSLNFLGSDELKAAQPKLPGKPIIPVLFSGITEHTQLPHLLRERAQFYSIEVKDVPRAWTECGSSKHDEFVSGLYDIIEKHLAIKASSQEKPLRCLSTRDKVEFWYHQKLQHEDIKHLQPSPGFCTSLENGELDPAKDIIHQPDAPSALELLNKWAHDPTSPHYAVVLGEFGIGKTTTLKQFTRSLLKMREGAPPKEKDKTPLPIFFDLRKHISSINDNAKQPTLPTLEAFLDELVERTWEHDGTGFTGKEVLRLVREEGAMIIFDGLDEKLVHLNEAQGNALIRMLWQVLPVTSLQRHKKRAPSTRPGRILLSCRSHYFPTIRSMNTTFTGDLRDGVKPADYYALIILPFQETQIRDYLASHLGEEHVDNVLELLASVHDLRGLAERPLFLELIRKQIHALERRKANGEEIRGVTLYEQMINDCLARDIGKHQIRKEHKKKLMEAIAADMWRSGDKEWRWEKVDEWLELYICTHTVMSQLYTQNIEKVSEDFRTATMVLRPDDSEHNFRFAHTSIQEYFLASYLYRALVDGRLEDWKLPMPSLETLDFLGQIFEVNPGAKWRSSMEQLISKHQEQASLAAFKYWMRALEKDMPTPSPTHIDLPGEDLERWRFGTEKQRLFFQGANFKGAKLRHTRWQNVDLTGADLRDVDMFCAELENVCASQAGVQGASFVGSVWRDCDMTDVETTSQAWWDAEWIRGEPPIALQKEEAFGDVWLQDSSTPGILHPSFRKQGHNGPVNGCSWSPDGKFVLSASWDKTLKIWDADSGKELQTLTGHSSWVNGCSWSPDGKRILSASDDETLKIWDADSGKEFQTLTEHGDSVLGCSWSPDGRFILSASGDNTLKIWDADSGKELQTLTGHGDSVFGCSWSPDGKHILSASGDNTLKIWDVASGQELQTLTGHGNRVSGCLWSPDGKRILSASWDNTLKIWDVASGQELRTLTGHGSWVNGCSWSPDGKRILSASEDETLKIWDADSGKELQTLTGHGHRVNGCSWSPDGKRILSAAWDNTLKIWDADSGKELQTLTGHGYSVFGCSWSPDGKHILSASWDNTLKIWDVASGQELRTLTGHGYRVNGCSWSPDGKRILSASDDETLKIWDADSGKELQTLIGHSWWVNGCSWSPDGKRILSASFDETLKIWDADSGKELQTLTGHGHRVNGCSWSPDGKHILSASWDKTLKIWDADSGKELQTLTGHGDSVFGCSWSPDG